MKGSSKVVENLQTVKEKEKYFGPLKKYMFVKAFEGYFPLLPKTSQMSLLRTHIPPFL